MKFHFLVKQADKGFFANKYHFVGYAFIYVVVQKALEVLLDIVCSVHHYGCIGCRLLSLQQI